MYISFRNRPVDETRPADGTRRTVNRVSSVVIALGIVSMLTDVSSESVSAILPVYVTGVLGLSTITYGVLDGLYQGVSALVRIAGGFAADRGNQPKWIAFIGYAVSAVSRIGLLFASGFAALVAVITADRLGKGIRTAPRDALIAASSAPESLAASFGVHRMLDNVGAAIGPILAFLVLFFLPGEYTAVFVISLACALAGLAILGFLVPNLRPDPSPRTERTRFDWASLKTPGLRRLLLVAGLFGIVTIGDGFVYLVLLDRDAFAAQWFPLLYVGTNLAFLAFAVPAGRLADRFGRVRVFLIGHAALLAAYVVAALPFAGVALTVTCLVLLGAFYAATDGILAALAAEVTPIGARATGIAAAQTVVALTRFAASVGFGVLWFAQGRASAIAIAAVALAVVLPAAALLIRRMRRGHPVP